MAGLFPDPGPMTSGDDDMRRRYAWGGMTMVVAAVGAVYLVQSCGWAFASASACASRCNAAYAVCYASSGADKATCQAKRNKCLKRCLRANRIN